MRVKRKRTLNGRAESARGWRERIGGREHRKINERGEIKIKLNDRIPPLLPLILNSLNIEFKCLCYCGWLRNVPLKLFVNNVYFYIAGYSE